MADFNPQADLPQAQNFTQYSKGYRDSSAGDLVGNVAKTFETGIKAMDRAVATSAQNEVTQIVQAADNQLFGIQTVGKAKDPLSREVRDQVRNLADKKQAMEAGTIDPSHYYATIQAKTKELRTRYAGYGDEIDSALKSHGIDPNWQREQILAEGAKAEARARARADDTDRNDRELIEGLIKSGLPMDPELRMRAVQPDAHLDKKLVTQLKYNQSVWASTKEVVTARKLEYDLAEADDKNAGNLYEKSKGAEYSAMFTSVLGNLPTYKRMQEIQADIAGRNARGETADPSQLAELKGGIQLLQQQMRASKMKIDAQYSGDQKRTFPEQDKVLDEAFERNLSMLTKSAENEQWGAFNFTKKAIEDNVNENKADFLASNENVGVLAAVEAFGGQNGVNMVFNSSTGAGIKLQSAVDEFAVKKQKAMQVVEKGHTLNTTMTNLRNGKIKDPNAYTAAFQEHLAMITNKDVDEKMKEPFINGLFSPDNKPFFDGIMSNSKLSDEQKMEYIRAVTSPDVQAEIARVSKLKNPELVKNYNAFVNYMTQKLVNKTVPTINDAIVNSSSVRPQYNEKTKELELIPRETPGTNPAQRLISQGWEAVKNPGYVAATKTFNESLRMLIPVWKEQGLNVDEEARNFVARSGIRFGTPYRGGNSIDTLPRLLNEPLNPGNIRGQEGNNAAPGGEGIDRLNPRGAPTAEITPEAQDYATKGLDLLTGIPSFVDAINSGDPTEIAKQTMLAVASGIIPLPAARIAANAAKSTRAVGEGTGQVVSSLETEIARVLKGMPEKDAVASVGSKSAATVPEMKSIAKNFEVETYGLESKTEAGSIYLKNILKAQENVQLHTSRGAPERAAMAEERLQRAIEDAQTFFTKHAELVGIKK